MEQPIALMATALAVEFNAVRAQLTEVVETQHPAGTVYDLGRFSTAEGSWIVALVQTDQGNPRAALEIERAIQHFAPRYVYFVGVAGGLKDVQLGDVVAATKVYGYHGGKADEVFKPRPDFGESTYAMTQRAKAVARQRGWHQRIPSGVPTPEPQAYVGPIAAGEQVVASTRSETYQLLRNYYSDALAVEMEGLGMLRATYANHAVEALVVRGISDMIDQKVEADARGSQPRAAQHAAAFAFEVLAQMMGAQRTSTRQGTNSTQSTSQEWWNKLIDIAVALYPLGPMEREIWARAGGDVAELHLQPTGKASWYNAVHLIRRGGGGKEISLERLLATMRADFAGNAELLRLEQTCP